MLIYALVFATTAAPSQESVVSSDEVCMLQLKEHGGHSGEGSTGKHSAQALQDIAIGLSVCGRRDKAGSAHCRMRGGTETGMSEEYKNIDGVRLIADPAAYSCYSFGKNDEVRTFRAPNFPTGATWPHLYRGRTEIPGLENARVYVVSLPDAEKRRHHFAQQWAALNLKMPIAWVEAANGRDPFSTTPFQTEFLHDLSPDAKDTHRGAAACWESHAGILSAVDGATAVILEDDVAFIGNFTARLKEFVGSLPTDWDILHIGGDTFWDPPFAEKPQAWMKTRAASRTWGYIVRDRAVPRLMRANQVTRDLRAIDTFYGGLSFACDKAYAMNTYAPPQPFVMGTGTVSATDKLHPHTSTVAKSLLANEYFEVLTSSRYTWYPSTCCTLPDVHAESFKSWCCKENHVQNLDYCRS